MDQTIYEDLLEILAYLESDEERHFEENDRPERHIYRNVMRVRALHVEGDNRPLAGRRAENAQRVDRPQPLVSVSQQPLLMGADARAADPLDIIERGAEADRLDDRRRARLEAVRWVVVGHGVERHYVDHLAAALVGTHGGKVLGLPVEHANAGGSVELVAGEGIEIDVEVGDVDIEMYGPLRAVDQHRYSAPVSKRYDLLDRRHRPEHIGHMGDRDDLRPVGQRALEILEQDPNVRAVVVPVSGGGLIGGVAAALGKSGRDILVVGVEPEFAADARESFHSGKIVRVEPEQTMRTMADGLRVPQLGALPFAQIRAFVQDIVTVSEDQIAEAMRRIAREARLVAEPSGAVAAAGALALGLAPSTTVAIVSGGNVDLDRYSAVLAG